MLEAANHPMAAPMAVGVVLVFLIFLAAYMAAVAWIRKRIDK